MRKQIKPFMVEVKRRPRAGEGGHPPSSGAHAGDPSGKATFATTTPDVSKSNASWAQAFAASADRAGDMAESPSTEGSETSTTGRVLPCLVSEAAAATAREETLAEAEARAPRGRRVARAEPPQNGEKRRPGRPRKNTEEATAPRKRGRPSAAETTRAASAPVPAAQNAPIHVVYQVSAGASRRALRRAAEVASLPRGQRWKRRLPKTIW